MFVHLFAHMYDTHTLPSSHMDRVRHPSWLCFTLCSRFAVSFEVGEILSSLHILFNFSLSYLTTVRNNIFYPKAEIHSGQDFGYFIYHSLFEPYIPQICIKTCIVPLIVKAKRCKFWARNRFTWISRRHTRCTCLHTCTLATLFCLQTWTRVRLPSGVGFTLCSQFANVCEYCVRSRHAKTQQLL